MKRLRALLYRWLICPVVGHCPIPPRRMSGKAVDFGMCACGHVERINVLNQPQRGQK